jgi:hypothetical protein
MLSTHVGLGGKGLPWSILSWRDNQPAQGHVGAWRR